MRRAMFTCVLMAATALASNPTLAQSAALADDLGALEADLVPMSDSELESERGGLLTPFGEVSFGAVLRTIIDGQVAMETQLTWTPEGAVQTVISNLGPTIQNATNPGKDAKLDLGATNNTLTGAGQPQLQNLPGVPQLADALNAGIDKAVNDTRPSTESGASLVGLSGQLTPPNNPTLDSVFDVLNDAKAVPTPISPNAPSTPALASTGGGGTSGLDVVDSALDFNPTGAPGTTVQQVTAATPTDVDDPIGDFVAATTAGQSTQQVAAAAKALGIDLGNITGGNAMVVAGENGGTAIVHNVTNSSLSNVVLNTASGQNIRIETDISIIMPGLEAFQQDILGQQLQMQLHDAIGADLLGAGL